MAALPFAWIPIFSPPASRPLNQPGFSGIQTEVLFGAPPPTRKKFREFGKFNCQNQAFPHRNIRDSPIVSMSYLSHIVHH